jgi:hypothetical protein
MSTQDKADPIEDFERELRSYAEGNGHWSRVASAREALQKALASTQQAEPAQAAVPLSDEQIVRSLEEHGVEFQRFLGGIAGTKDCWSTAGSQEVRKIAAGVRALIAAWGVKLEGGE